MTAITGPGQNPMVSGSGISGTKRPHGYKLAQLQNFTPEQMQLFSQLFSNLGPDSFLSKLAGGDEEAFGQIEAPALRQFNQVLGGIGSKFSGMGSGARRSSGFQNATTSAASNFAQELQSNRQSLQRQALMDLFSLSNQLLEQRPYDQFLVEKQKKPSFWSSVAPFAGAAVGGLVGGPAGAGIGYGVGKGASEFL